MYSVFIDGSAGTTGLRIRERLAGRSDISLIVLEEAVRKDPAARKEALNSADIVFLCLPDAASIEAASMIENPNVKVLDTSTAHRTDPGWVYGLPELDSHQAEKIAASKRIAVPGCHASGFIALVRPLIDAGVISNKQHIVCHSLTGYSGGGKKMIAEYQAEDRDPLLDAPRPYGLTQQHKHLKEMKAMTGIEQAPVFCPIVADFYSGMTVTVGLFGDELLGGANIETVKQIYAESYGGPVVRYMEAIDEGGFISAGGFSGDDGMQISVCGNGERMLPAARYDNLGKGASGAAIQCMNILLGVDQTTGLTIK